MGYNHIVNRVAQTIAEEILTDGLAAGTRLPPMRRLAERHQVSYVTMHRALKKMAESGLIGMRPGSGSFVADGFNARAINAAFKSDAPPSPRFRSIGVMLPVWVEQGGKRSVYDVLDGFCESCSQYDWRIELITPNLEEINSRILTQKILDKKFDGFVWLTPLALHHWILEQISEQVDCLVVTERPFEKIGLTTIHPDFYRLAQDTVELFIGRGHREIMCFCGQYYDVWSDPYTEMLLDAMRQAADTAGLQFDDSCFRQVFPMPDAEAEAIIRATLTEHPEKNAFFCMYNSRLPGIIRELRRLHPGLNQESLTIVDNCYKSNPFYEHAIDGLGIYRVKYPDRKIGAAIAAVFEQKWRNVLHEPIPIRNTIIPPGEKY
jgi:DNA-binding LacI/PurR family transcriptional regulator